MDRLRSQGNGESEVGSEHPYADIVRLILEEVMRRREDAGPRDPREEAKRGRKWSDAYAACRPRVVAQITRQYPHVASEAEGVFHWSYRNAFRAIWNGREPKNARAWFATIVGHEAAKEGIRLGKASASVPLTPVSPDNSPSQALIKEEERCMVRALVEQLERDHRLVICLTFHLQWSDERIAQTMHVNPEYVRVIRHRAIRRLREMIGGGNND